MNLERAKQLYPSCARDWTVEMVEQAWPKLSTLLPRRLERVDGGILSDETRRIYGLKDVA